MKNKDLVSQWMSRVKGNIAYAKVGKISDDIFYEDLCFNIQQAVEKALKALLIGMDIEYPFTHSIGQLINLIEKQGLVVPDKILETSYLTEYAVETRYPDAYRSLNERDYLEGLELAQKAVAWVEKELEKLP